MSAFESAIDDSFDPLPQPLEDEETDDESLFDNAYNGPRDGRWEVASSVGSFVDDRCPTVYGYRPQIRPEGRESRIDDGLVKRLMQATVEHKRVEAAARAQQNVFAGGEPAKDVQVPSAPPSVKVSRPFFVPPLRNEAYNLAVMAKQGDYEELSRDPLPTMRPPPKANSEFRDTATREATTRKAEVAKAKSDSPRGFTPDRSTVRILGRNGEEAFISLPSLAKSVHASSHRTQQRSEAAVSVNGSQRSTGNCEIQEKVAVPDVAQPEEQDQEQKQEPKPRVKNRQRNNKQKKPQDKVEQLITESPQDNSGGSQQAASFGISGALPASSRAQSQAPSQALQSAANSLRDSGIAMSDFIASVKEASNRASSVRSEAAISAGALSIAEHIAQMRSANGSVRNSKPKTVEGFKEIGLGMTTGFPPRERTSDRSDHGRARKGSSSRHGSQPSVRRDSGSVQQNDEGSEQGNVRSNYKPPTVVSASSSASITHSFGGFYQEGFVPQDQPTVLRREGDVDSRDGGSDRSRSVRSGSARNGAQNASDAASSRYGQYGSLGHRSERSISIRSDRGSSVHSGANYVSNVEQIRSGSQAQRSDHSRSNRSDRGGSIQSVASHASVASSSTPKTSNFQATSMTPHSGSDRLSQASGTRYPSHSPLSPLAPTPQLITPDPEQTRFAGGGWISPHPCTTIPSHDTAVYISADGPGHCGTLTYSEWRSRREALDSDIESYAGSRVPSAVGLQPLPDEAYGHPPPASYVGSYNPDPRYASLQPVPQMDGEPAWISQHFSPLQGANVMQLPASVHSQQLSLRGHSSGHSHRGSLRSQSSAHSQQGSLRSHSPVHSRSGNTSTAHNNSHYNRLVHQTPIATSQNAGWSFPPEDKNSTSNHSPAYNVGLTPAELLSYQNQLGNTISRYSSQLSHVQREQTPPQPDYEVWNSGQSHRSSRRSSPSQHSIHNFPPNLSYPRVKSQLPMPWDPTVSQVNARSAVPVRQVSSSAGSSRNSRHTASVGGVGVIGSHLRSNASSSRGSAGSRESFGPAESHVTYGTAEWQNLEDAEEGRGGFHVPGGHNMW